MDRLREQFPILAPQESAPIVEDTNVSLLPQPRARVEEDAVEFTKATVNGHGPVSAAPPKTEPRLELHVRGAGRPEPSRSFDAFWPKKPRPGQGTAPVVRPVPAVPPPVAIVPPAAPEAQTAQVLPFEPVLPAEPTQFQFREAPPAPEPVVMAAAPAAPGPISILKSGIVDGMAYTLYSDGSIEAQLPQGMLRFGSIAELRNHIEQSA